MKSIRTALNCLVSLTTLLTVSPVHGEVEPPMSGTAPQLRLNNCTEIAAMFPQTAPGQSSLDEALASKHGLFTQQHGSDIEYFAYIGDKQIAVSNYSPLTGEMDLKKRDEDLQRKTEEKLAALERKFAITVSRNQTIKHAANHGAKLEKERAIDVRQPNFGETLALEYALERSLPTTGSKTELQFLFPLQCSLNGALAEWELSTKNKPTVVVEPGTGDRQLEYVLMHELSHHSQYKMGLDPLAPFNWKMTHSLGWQTFTNPLTGETDWAIATTTGLLYKYSSSMRKWISCNKSGQPVDCIGSRVAHQREADHMTSKEIASIAKVRPCTAYMSNPLEVMAEGLAMYRMSKVHRSALLKKSPELYEIIKDFDQKLIAKHYGAGMMRSVDGLVVSLNDSAESHVRDFESHIIASTPTP
ncbi:MAG: hypothetical protein K2W95_27915 [Candidatus Obscuribacterales bacterium]|nr:hypothetical protein [Candidatus Obscuribacterales bacterium]